CTRDSPRSCDGISCNVWRFDVW
nr:immunoglobulin heavy chain junction region [Macaca mulatta]MOV56052.1 immunoglobulin heavy chain junction region [Macaca mulatta]